MCHTLSFHHVKANDISARLHMSVIANKCYSVSTELCVSLDRITQFHNLYTHQVHITLADIGRITIHIYSHCQYSEFNFVSVYKSIL